MFCPSCGAGFEVDQRFAHLVVCGFCDSSVILDERAARISGKMAALAPPTGRFRVGAQGSALGRDFHVLGRVRYGYAAGYWDEWFLAFEDGSPAWISEDEERLVIENPLDPGPVAVTHEGVRPGDPVTLFGRRFVVDEKDVATCEGGEGQLPFPVVAGETVPFLDCSDGDQFATLEFDAEGLRVFRGRRLDPAELEVVGAPGPGGAAELAGAVATGRERVVKGAGASLSVRCEQCAAPLEVAGGSGTVVECGSCGHSVDLTLERVDCPDCDKPVALQGGPEAGSVVCPHCRAYLDLEGSAVQVLSRLRDQRKPSVPFALGDRATFDGEEHVVAGHLRLVNRSEGYHCNEFLLRASGGRYRWLVLDGGHLMLKDVLDGRPEVVPRNLDRRDAFPFDGRTWRVYERGLSGEEVDWVDGELPWVARSGDRSCYMDAICPPEMLTAEWTETEQEWFVSRYLSRREVAEAFGREEWKLPMASGIGACQPYEEPEEKVRTRRVVLGFAAVFLLGLLWSLVAGSEAARWEVPPEKLGQKGLVVGETSLRAGQVMRLEWSAPLEDRTLILQGGWRPTATADGKERARFRQTLKGSFGSVMVRDSFLFTVPERGRYALEVDTSLGGQIPGKETPVPGPLVVRLIGGVMLARWWVLSLAIVGLWLFWDATARVRFEWRRWAQEDD